MNFFTKHRTLILRIFGILLLLLAFGTHYAMPPAQMSENEKAAQRLARMEVKASPTRVVTTKNTTNPYRSNYEEYKEKQIEYFTFLFMLLGLGFLISSFMNKK